MSKLGKILISVGSCLIIAVVAILIYIFWPAITGTINGSKYYTSQDVQNAYDQGYTDGNKSEESLTAKYEYYKSLVDEYYVEVESLNRELLVLTESNNSFSSQVVELEAQKDLLEEQVNNLTTIKSNNELTIEDLESQVITLQNEVVRLQNDLTSNAQLIAQKNNQILSLQSTISQLQTTNELNLQTINNLNNQITTLNNQISDMTLQIQNNSSNVSALNSKIAELEKSVAYYEQYIANLEQGEQVVVTFEFNGSVYNIQIVNKNDVVSVVNPTSTDHVIFNYWTVNGEQVDLSTYQFTANTKIVADVTYKYDVKFMVDESIYNNQIVVKNGFATIPDAPSKTNYEFDGWTINGVDLVDVSSYEITENTTFVAKFTKYHTVTFMYEDEVIETQYVKNNGYATDVNIDSTDYEVFNGWTLNSVIVNITSQKVVADTTFIASITYKHDVKFMVDDEVYNHQIVEENTYTIVPENPTKDGYIFKGWSINGVDIVNVSLTVIDSNVEFVSIFEPAGFAKQVWNGPYAPYAGYMWRLNDKVYVSYGAEQFVLNEETNTWEEMTWKGITTKPDGSSIWFLDNNVYYSNGSKQGILNQETNTWEEMTWNVSSFYGYNVWTIGDNVYYSLNSSHYVLNKETNTWEVMTWNGLTSFGGQNVWTDGTDYYFTEKYIHYKLNQGTNTWEEVTLGEQTLYYGKSVWTDGINIYSSDNSNQFIFNKSTKIWEEMTWNGVSSFSASEIWIDGDDIYSLTGLLSDTCKLNKETNTWELYSFYGFYKFNGSDIWTDGENFYHNKNFMLNQETNTWESVNIDWSVISNFRGAEYIWTDGINTYYSYYGVNCKFDKENKVWIKLDYTGSIYGNDFWTDGVDYYYIKSSKQYKLNQETNTWDLLSWTGLKPDPDYMWTDGINIYYSKTSSHYVLNKETNTWEVMTWNGLTSFSASAVWSDGINVYYTSNSTFYILDKETNTWNIKIFDNVDITSASYIWTDGVNIYYSYGFVHYIFMG